ncbi:MAG: cell division protein ZapB [Treponema sp.]|nr:cell division protein ZapB [Treponema sp.]
MVSLEQVKLLESKVSNVIEYVKKANEENAALKNSLDSYQKRIEELQAMVKQFSDEQGKIEEGILSALDRLNQFEDAVEGVLHRSRDEGSEEKEAESGELDIF